MGETSRRVSALRFIGTLLCAACAFAPRASATTEPLAYLFSYFTRNGEDGLHLAYSPDSGTTWLALNGG